MKKTDWPASAQFRAAALIGRGISCSGSDAPMPCDSFYLGDLQDRFIAAAAKNPVFLPNRAKMRAFRAACD